MPTIVRTSEVREELQRVLARRDKAAGDIYFYFHRAIRLYMWGNKELARAQMIQWRRHKLAGELFMNGDYNHTVSIGGKTWHILVVQYGADPDSVERIGIDPLGLGFDDEQFVVNGEIFVFKHKINRDRIFNYVMKPDITREIARAEEPRTASV